MKRIRKIMVPIDLELDPTSIFEWVVLMALAFGAQVILVHIFEGPGYEGPTELHLADRQNPAVQEGLKPWPAAQTMMKHLENLEELGIQASGKMAFGEPEETLRSLALQEPADLLVMGSHSREGLDRLVHGSFSAAVIRSSPCPVLVLPHVPALAPLD